MVLAAPITLNIAKNMLHAVKGLRRSNAGLKSNLITHLNCYGPIVRLTYLPYMIAPQK